MPGHFMWSGTSEPPNRGGLRSAECIGLPVSKQVSENSIPLALLSLGSSGQHGVFLCCLKRPLDPALRHRRIGAYSSTERAEGLKTGESMAG